MQVAPLSGRAARFGKSRIPALALVAARSSAGNDNKPGSPSAHCAQPVLPQDSDRSRKGRVAGSRRGGTQETGQCLVSSPSFGRTRPKLLGAAVLFWERQVASDKGEADSGLLPESEGSAQLGTAGLLSVCLSLSKSTPPPPSLSIFPSASSLPPSRSLQPA